MIYIMFDKHFTSHTPICDHPENFLPKSNVVHVQGRPSQIRKSWADHLDDDDVMLTCRSTNQKLIFFVVNRVSACEKIFYFSFFLFYQLFLAFSN